MKTNRYIPVVLVAAAALSGCGTAPKNVSLDEAHAIYSSARNNPEITELAAVELKRAGDTLNRADKAVSTGESTDEIDNLAYIAKQQVAIAEQTAKRKSAEQEVTEAGAARDKLLLEARTSEAERAKQQAQQARQQAEQATQEAQQATRQLEQARERMRQDQDLIARQNMQLEDLHAKESERGLVITLGDVLFRTGQSTLEPGGMRNVQKLADFLKQYPQYKTLIEGYTDSVGSEAMNQSLSERRANAVKAALMNMGIGAERIRTHGYGEAYPVANNNTAAGRQLNRRVEVILSDRDSDIAPRR